MQTSAISLRVADFLRQHAPFDTIPEDDLLLLAQRGRVKFHESDEFVYWQNAKPNPLVYVVQRGSVALVEEHNGQEHLRDLLGAGDIFGVEQFLGTSVYRASARTNCDVLLYAFHWKDFEALLERHPHVGRFLATHAALDSDEPDPSAGATAGESRVERLSEVLSPRPALTCSEDTPLSDAVKLLRGGRSGAIAVLDHRGRPSAVLDLCAAASAGTSDQACIGAAHPHPVLFDPMTPAHEALLALATSPCPAGLVTADGSADSRVLAAFTAQDLAAFLAGHPYTFLDQIPAAPDHATLHWLHRRARQAILQQLASPASIDWLAQLAHQLDRAILQRILALAGLDALPACWCFSDASGRRETLTAASPSVALICDDSSAAEFMNRLPRALSECGYHGEASHFSGTLAEWRSRFTHWIADPVTYGIGQAGGLFDLVPAAGDPASWLILSAHVSSEMRAQPNLAPLMANDALANLPPLTFFEDAVVDEAGERHMHFELGRTALTPLVDVARVLGVKSGNVLGFSTAERLRLGGGGTAAEDALRSVLFYQARSGLRHHTAGLTIAPSELGRLDRLALKSAFRSIGQLLQEMEKLAWQGAV